MHTVIHEYARCNQNYFYLVKKYCRRNIGTINVGYRIYLADFINHRANIFKIYFLHRFAVLSALKKHTQD